MQTFSMRKEDTTIHFIVNGPVVTMKRGNKVTSIFYDKHDARQTWVNLKNIGYKRIA